MQNPNKKQKFQNKTFYVSLLATAIVLTLIGILSINPKAENPKENLSLSSNSPENPDTQSAKTEEKTKADLSSESESILKKDVKETAPVSTPQTEVAVNASSDKPIPTDTSAGSTDENASGIEKPTDDKNPVNTEELPESETAANAGTVENTASPSSVTSTAGKSVEELAENLHFDQKKGLLWPVIGDVILNYSMNEGVYFKTLGQYKCNPAILISAKKNTPVYAAADGVIEKVEKNDETGLTITSSIGDDFQVIYGQLKKAAVKEGDQITEGQEIGKLAKPSNCYVMEGEHLFLEVLEDGKPVDPMLLLR